jgi:hypothetical protein
MGLRPLLGVAGEAELDDLVADRDAEPDDEGEGAICRGIQELPCRRDKEGPCLGSGICSTG